MSAATPEAILRAVEKQRMLLLNVNSVVRVMKFSDEADGGELCGALELIERELQRILNALEGPALEEAAAASPEEEIASEPL